MGHGYYQTQRTAEAVAPQVGEFHFQAVYRKEILNMQDEALSRLKSLGKTTVPVEDEQSCFLMKKGGRRFPRRILLQGRCKQGHSLGFETG